MQNLSVGTTTVRPSKKVKMHTTNNITTSSECIPEQHQSLCEELSTSNSYSVVYLCSPLDSHIIHNILLYSDHQSWFISKPYLISHHWYQVFMSELFAKEYYTQSLYHFNKSTEMKNLEKSIQLVNKTFSELLHSKVNEIYMENNIERYSTNYIKQGLWDACQVLISNEKYRDVMKTFTQKTLNNGIDYYIHQSRYHLNKKELCELLQIEYENIEIVVQRSEIFMTSILKRDPITELRGAAECVELDYIIYLKYGFPLLISIRYGATDQRGNNANAQFTLSINKIEIYTEKLIIDIHHEKAYHLQGIETLMEHVFHYDMNNTHVSLKSSDFAEILKAFFTQPFKKCLMFQMTDQ